MVMNNEISSIHTEIQKLLITIEYQKNLDEYGRQQAYMVAESDIAKLDTSYSLLDWCYNEGGNSMKIIQVWDSDDNIIFFDEGEEELLKSVTNEIDEPYNRELSQKQMEENELPLLKIALKVCKLIADTNDEQPSWVY